ncbi:GNAT family N-acetyltransferase [Actinocrispum wychmicini]|uniref:Acetyltransferase (GNAT) family protein n=1 Tax=Actinocrispum wychmicini TaxID=1213861 RepID=A0A4R2ILC4_9PSEU|nr:GNAT family N-acetyltransferase [Actinocrispum wychmicini]TCO44709.1 acetyltransferase (GNAT) family protein [Actinocrispum wychmicini]
MAPTIFVTDNPDKADIKTVEDGLNEYNVQTYGRFDPRPLAVLVRDEETGQVIGGLEGRTALGLLFVELLYLPESLRGSGLGARLLQEAEEEAVRRGCGHGVLYTVEWQAPGFYVKHGWRVFGEVPSTPEGASRIFMTKQLH